MSNIDDDEALFEDIYEDKVEEKASGTEGAAGASDGATGATDTTTGTTATADTDKKEEKSDAETADDSKSTATADTQPPPPPAPTLAPAPAAAPAPGQMPDFSQLQQFQQQQFQPQYQQQYQQPPPQAPPAMAPSNMGRDSGKMFIGGLNWDTSEQGLIDYFSQYGEIMDHTIMRDSATGRSRGFGFLTFKDPTSVDAVIKKDHVLDGKLIDPKRAIARDEQDKVGKIFVGGIDPLVNEEDFNSFFAQFGHIIDAQLMVDKDTGRSRGFGFITYDSPEAVDRVCVNKYLSLKGKAMEVKRAEPRGQHQLSQQQQQQQQPYGYNPYSQYGQMQYGQMPYGQAGGNTQGMNQEMMTEYWQRMQQWYMFQQQQQGGELGDSAEQPDQPLNPQQQDDEEKPEEPARDNGYGARNDTYSDSRRNYGAPRGPRRGTPSGPGGFRGRGRGRGGYNRGRGYHPYSRGGRR